MRVALIRSSHSRRGRLSLRLVQGAEKRATIKPAANKKDFHDCERHHFYRRPRWNEIACEKRTEKRNRHRTKALIPPQTDEAACKPILSNACRSNTFKEQQVSNPLSSNADDTDPTDGTYVNHKLMEPLLLTSTTDSPPGELEVIGGLLVHPLASRFALIVGKEFDDLVEAVQRSGTVAAVEFHDGLLIDGRNRVRAVVELRRQGIEIELPTIEWQPKGEETVAEHIYSVNVNRRHLTVDQRVALAIDFLPTIRQSRLQRQSASRFGAGGRSTAEQNSSPPDGQAEKPTRTSQEKDAASSVGQLATLCGVTRHKASQGITLDKSLKDGTVSLDDFSAVIQGTKPLRKVLPVKKKASGKKPSSKKTSRPAVDLMFTSESHDDDLIADAINVVDDEQESPDVTVDEISRRWERFKGHFAVADHGELRKKLAKIIADEQREFNR